MVLEKTISPHDIEKVVIDTFGENNVLLVATDNAIVLTRLPAASRAVYTIQEIKERFEEVAKKYEIDEAYLFGSYARGDATPESDVDFYIRADNMKCALDLSGIWIDAAKAMNKKVDVITTKAIMEKEFEQEMKKELIKIYG